MKAVKFNFGEDFEAQNQDQEELEARALEDRMRRSEEAAFQKGFTSGKTEASEEIAKELVAAMEKVAEQVNLLFGQRAELEDRLERDAAQLGLAMARKLASKALEMHPHAEIEALVTECMEACREQPKIVVRLSEKQCEPLAAKIEELKNKNGFTGDVIVIGDDEIRDGDCLVEWPDGGAEHRAAHISQAIEKLVQAFVMKPPAAARTKTGPETSEATEAAGATEATEVEDTQGEKRDEKIADENNKHEARDDQAPETEQPGAL